MEVLNILNWKIYFAKRLNNHSFQGMNMINN